MAAKKVIRIPLGGTRVAMLMPEGSRLLSVGVGAKGPSAWFEANLAPVEWYEAFSLLLVPTGMEFDVEADFVGTVIEGRYVWHVFRESKVIRLPASKCFKLATDCQLGQVDEESMRNLVPELF